MQTRDKIVAPCSSCVRKTRHEVLYATSRKMGKTTTFHGLIQCGGCGTISLLRRRVTEGEEKPTDAHFPSPVSRPTPDWVYDLYFWGSKPEEAISKLLEEVYAAVAGGQHRL